MGQREERGVNLVYFTPPARICCWLLVVAASPRVGCVQNDDEEDITIFSGHTASPVGGRD